MEGRHSLAAVCIGKKLTILRELLGLTCSTLEASTDASQSQLACREAGLWKTVHVRDIGLGASKPIFWQWNCTETHLEFQVVTSRQLVPVLT